MKYTHCVRLTDSIPEDGIYIAVGGPYEYSFLDTAGISWSIGISPNGHTLDTKQIRVIVENGKITVTNIATIA